MLAEVAEKMGVPKLKMVLEKKSENFGQNIEYTRKLLNESGKMPKNIISCHMPYAERKDYATIRKQWPEVGVVVASPRVPFYEYHIRGFQGTMSQEELISDMLGDFQRLFVYPKEGFMIEQEEALPGDVKVAYLDLKDRGFTEHLLRDESGNIIEI